MTSRRIRGRPGYERDLEPSNFLAMSRRYQSGSCRAWPHRDVFSALRPSRLPISASVDLSGSVSRNRGDRCARTMRFSATRYYSFRKSNS
jgi:hypothetical protein